MWPWRMLKQDIKQPVSMQIKPNTQLSRATQPMYRVVSEETITVNKFSEYIIIIYSYYLAFYFLHMKVF